MSVPGRSRAVLDPATRRSLRRRWLVVVAPALLAAGLLVGAVVGLAAARTDRGLDDRGAPADATVTEVVSRIVARDRTPDGSIRVRFAPADGRPREVAVDVGRAVGGFHQGDAVAIVYDPRDPEQIRLLGVDRHRRGVPTLLLAGLGSALGVMALLSGRRAWRIGRVVRREPWWPVESRLVQVPQALGFRQGFRTLARLDVPSGPLLVEPAGLGRLDSTCAPEAWVAGLEGPTIVLAAPGGGHVLAVRRRSGGGVARTGPPTAPG